MSPNEIDDFFPARLEYTNHDLVVFRGSGILLGLHVAADGGNTGATLYDGVNAVGQVKCRITVLDSTSYQLSVPTPVLFRNGLFVECDDANARVTVAWSPLPEKLPDE